ncbi:MAG: hypothetical protein Q8L91_12405 [Polaromonas sp.]|nr:hypothetical protein [Polaromonas sp.]
MNTKFIASALIAAAGFTSAGAFAAGADNAPEQKSSFMSMQTRAAVQAQALTAQQGPVTASNQVDGGTVTMATPAAGDRSRANVRAEAGLADERFGSAPGRA